MVIIKLQICNLEICLGGTSDGCDSKMQICGFCDCPSSDSIPSEDYGHLLMLPALLSHLQALVHLWAFHTAAEHRSPLCVALGPSCLSVLHFCSGRQPHLPCVTCGAFLFPSQSLSTSPAVPPSFTFYLYMPLWFFHLFFLWFFFSLWYPYSCRWL